MRAGKLLVFVCIAALHIAAIAVFEKLLRAVPTQSSEFYSTLTFVDPPTIEVQPTQRRSRREKTSLAESQPHQSTAITPPSQPPSDWWQLAEQSVTGSVSEEAAKQPERSLSSQPETIDSPPKIGGNRSLFTTPAFKYGDTQRFEDGELITWVSDRCYYTNRQEGSMLSAKQSRKVCRLTPPMLGGDDLLAELKPKYLREQPKIPTMDSAVAMDSAVSLSTEAIAEDSDSEP